MKTYNVGVIGLGIRGAWWATDMLPELEYVNVTAICDLYEDRIEAAAKKLEEKGKAAKLKTTDFRELISSPLVDVVFVLSAWGNHYEATMMAMDLHKPVGLEVGGAYSIQECYDLVRKYEETKTPVMMLENCCYGEVEMTVMNMARKGVLGKIVHCDGSYSHDLRKSIAGLLRDRHYRCEEYMKRNCESYPTHEIGPIAKLLGIGSGNRFVSLVSMASRAEGMKEYLSDKPESYYHGKDFMQGDVFTTMIKCAGGETVTIRLDTTLPRYYTRSFTVRGTKGMYEEQTNSLFLDSEHNDISVAHNWRENWGNMEKYIDEHRHPLWVKFREEGVKGNHGGMDYLVTTAFFEALDKGQPMPIDIYDAVCWMAITTLSEQSIQLGSQSVLFPDFTGGKWINPKEKQDSLYWLD